MNFVKNFGSSIERTPAGAAAFGLVLASLLLPLPASAAKISAIEFKNERGTSTIEIKADGPISYDKQENSQDKQVVIDIKGTTLSAKSNRVLDTSSFNSHVTLVSPYSVDGDSRIVIQLRKMVGADVSASGNTLRVKFPSPAGGDEEDSKSAATAEADLGGDAEGEDAAVGDEPEEVASDETETEDSGEDVAKATKSPARKSTRRGSDPLDEFLEARETRRFIGRPITIQVRNGDLLDVFRLISEASGFNLFVGDGVAGNITLNLTDVPWDQALDVILRSKRLGAERSNNLLRIVTLTSLKQEKQEELGAKQAAEANAPRITRIFPVSYAKLADLQALLQKFITGNTTQQNQQGGTINPLATPIVTIDERTNSLIVRETPDNVDRIRKLIEVLDTQTPQILIEGKVIEASETFSRGIGGNLGVAGSVLNGSSSAQNFAAGFNGGSVGAFSLPTGAIGGGGAAFQFSPYTGFIPQLGRLNAAIALNEAENKLKVISSPRSVVLNKESATISQTTPKARTVIQRNNDGSTTTTVAFDSANLSLNVIPTVTNDASVLLQVTLTRDVPLAGANAGVSQSSVSTRVIVPSGGTLVIGGIYVASSNTDASGLPWLRKIPILGALFGSESEDTARAELLYFITPRILNSNQTNIGKAS
jgi:type IV pilus assembly protein PilQ